MIYLVQSPAILYRESDILHAISVKDQVVSHFYIMHTKHSMCVCVCLDTSMRAQQDLHFQGLELT